MSEVQIDMTTTVNDPPAAPEPESHSSPRLGTEYVILSLEADTPGDSLVGTTWRVQLESIVGTSADNAIRQYTDGPEQPGTFVAVPVRSFQPRTVVAEKTTVMRFT